MTTNTIMSCSIRATSPQLWACSTGRCAPSGTLSQISAQRSPTGSMRAIPTNCSNIAGDPQPTRAEIVHYYASKMGCDASQIAFYLTLARFKLAVIVQQIYYRYHQGLTKDERFASMPERVQMLLRAALQSAQTGRI